MDIHRKAEKLIERHRNGDLGRRSFLGMLGMAAAQVGLVGTGLGAFATRAVAAESLRYDGWGGVAQEGFTKLVLDPFTKKTGVTVTQGSFGSMEEFMTQVRAGRAGQYNLASLNTRLVYKQFYDLGLLEPMDETKIPRLDTVSKTAIDGYKSLSKGELCAVPSILSVVGILYNTGTISPEQAKAKGADILIDPDYKGHIVGEDNWFKRIWYAALQAGQDPNDIKDMDAIWDKIRESRSMVVKYWSSGAEQMNLMANGTALVSDGWGVRWFHLKEQGYPIGLAFPDGIYADIGGMMTLKGAPLEATYAMIDILLTPEVQWELAIEQGNTPLLDPDKVAIPEKVKAAVSGYDENGKLRLHAMADPDYWSANAAQWQKQYQRVMVRG